MIYHVPLRPGVVLANVRYKWTSLGGESDEQSNGVTQPSTFFPLFRVAAEAPVTAEELLVYDATDTSNYKVLSAK